MVYIQDESSNWTTVTRRAAHGGDMRILLKHQDVPLLLEHGDVIRICHAKSSLIFISDVGEHADKSDESVDDVQSREIKVRDGSAKT